MKKFKEIYEYEDGTAAVVVDIKDGKKELMLLHKPHFLGVMDEKHKEKLFQWLLDKEIEKHKEGFFSRWKKEVLKWLFHREYQIEKEVEKT